jgi:hypothetical protein
MITFRKLADGQARAAARLRAGRRDGNRGSALGMVGHRRGGDPERFKVFVESRRMETGAWRGEV